MALAERCVQLTGGKAAPPLDTLAAAYAEVGRFDDAINSQKRAIELAPPEQRKPMVDRLTLYTARTAYREAAWEK